MTALEQLQSDVAAAKTLKDEVVALLSTLSKQISDLVAQAATAAAATEAAALSALSLQLQEQNKELTDSIAASTAPPHTP